MKVTVPGYSTVDSSPEAILNLLKEARIFGQAEGDDYIESIKEIAKRCYDLDLNVQGETYEERAESLLREMAKHGLVLIDEEREAVG